MKNFLPDRDKKFYFLRGHLPPVAENVARAYVEAFSAPGDLVIDPFAHAPSVARAAYQAGRRVVAVESNPLAALVTRVEASPPGLRLIEDALKGLGETPKDELLLRDHLDGLYATTCTACGERVIADEYIYSSELAVPVEKTYRCAKDGARHDATTDAERAQFAAFEKRGFHYHFIWNRVSDALGGDVRARNLRDALATYTPRNLYALVTLWLKLDVVLEKHPAREALRACFVHALDQGSLLYAPRDDFPARKIPLLAVEKNIWRVFTDAARGLKNHAPIRLEDNFDALLAFSEPGAFIARGSSRQLAGEGKLHAQAALILTNPPQLDPTFWTLSYLWARWVWGRNSREAETLEPFLEPERHRWSWYGDALTNASQTAAQFLRPDGRVVFAFPSGNHAMIEALCLAASASGLTLEEYLYRPQVGARATSEFGAWRADYRITFRVSQPRVFEATTPTVLARRIRDEALGAAQEILAERNEPLSYAWLYQHALARVSQGGLVAQLAYAKYPRYDNPYQFLHRELANGMKQGYARDLDHWKDNERVLWFQREAEGSNVESGEGEIREQIQPAKPPPLCERVEDLVRELLARVQQISESALDDAVLSTLKEWLTPEPELVFAAASAYGELREGVWLVREENHEAERAHALDVITRLGDRLGFETTADKPPFDWRWFDYKTIPASSAGAVGETRVREPSHSFVFPRRAAFREFVARRVAPLQGIVLVSEQRLPLVREMVWRMPTVTKIFYDEGWSFLRVKIAEEALEWEGLAQRHWRALLGLEPPFEKGKEQLELF